MSETPSPYVAALALERSWHPDRKLAIDAELVRAGWYVNDAGELKKVQAKAERVDLPKPPENTAEPAPQHRADPTPAEVRAWAKENGVEVAAKGAIPADVLERYKAAQGR